MRTRPGLEVTASRGPYDPATDDEREADHAARLCNVRAITKRKPALTFSNDPSDAVSWRSSAYPRHCDPIADLVDQTRAAAISSMRSRSWRSERSAAAGTRKWLDERSVDGRNARKYLRELKAALSGLAHERQRKTRDENLGIASVCCHVASDQVKQFSCPGARRACEPRCRGGSAL